MDGRARINHKLATLAMAGLACNGTKLIGRRPELIIFDDLIPDVDSNVHLKANIMKRNRQTGFIGNPFTQLDKDDFMAGRVAGNIIAGEAGYKRHLFYAKALAMLGLVEFKKEVA